MPYTIEESYAAVPGEISISKQKFLDYFGVRGIRRLMYRIVLSFPKRLLYSILKNNVLVSHWISITEHFKFGCVNPAIVLNQEKGLVAAFTNLTNSGNVPTPVIKIYKEKLHLVQREIFTGQKISTVALYYRNPKQVNASASIDFDPKVPDCFTNDYVVCDQTMNKLSVNSWKCLELGLAQLKEKEKLGLHHVDLDKELVNSSY